CHLLGDHNVTSIDVDPGASPPDTTGSWLATRLPTTPLTPSAKAALLRYGIGSKPPPSNGAAQVNPAANGSDSPSRAPEYTPCGWTNPEVVIAGGGDTWAERHCLRRFQLLLA